MTKITLRSYNREIEALTDQGKIDLAIAHSLHILKYFPKHVDTYRLLGKAYLENQRLGDAADIFQRVLSAVPDDFVSHIGMSIIREDEGNLDASIWHMQRAYDVQSSNITIQDELRRLYDKRDGIEPPKIRLTRAALARMYARGDLINEAISELRSALQEEPDRADLLVLLARMYYTNNQRVKSIQTCSQVLNKLPYCLDANIIISQALVDTNREEESRQYITKATELDPYAAFISEHAPTINLVPDAAVTLLKLDEAEITGSEAQPSWVASLGADLPAGDEGDEDIDWLLDENAEEQADDTVMEDLDSDTEFAASLASSEAFGTGFPEPDIDETDSPTSPAEIEFGEEDDDQLPAWMKEAGWEPGDPDKQPEESLTPVDQPESSPEQDDIDELAPADIPDWLQAMAPAEGVGDTMPSLALSDKDDATQPGMDVPDWLKDLTADVGETALTGSEETTSASGDLPDWLADMDVEGQADLPEGEEAAAAGDMPDWLADMDVEGQADLPEGEEEAAAAGDMPDWLADMDVEGQVDLPEGEEEAAAVGDVPDWLADMDVEGQVDLPEGEEDLATIEDQPDWMSEMDVPEGLETEIPMQDAPEQAETLSGEVPDWLQSIEADETESEAEVEETAKAWLASMTGASLEEEEELLEDSEEIVQADEEELPDWLKEMADRSGESSATESEKTGVTLWLRRGEDEDEDVEPVQHAEEAFELDFDELETTEAEMPRDEETLGVAQPEDADLEAIETTDQVPDWLQGYRDDDLADIPETSDEMEDLPESVEEEAAEAEIEMPDFTNMDDTDAAMRWLESLAAKQGAREEELLTSPEERTEQPPAWVQSMTAAGTEEIEPDEELEEEAFETPMTSSEFEEEPADSTQPAIPVSEEAGLDWEAEDLPDEDEEEVDWSEAVSFPEQVDETVIALPDEGEQEADAAFAIEDLEEEGGTEADRPDWLTSETEEPAVADADIPDWLKEIDIEEEGAEEGADESLPAWLEEIVIEESEEEEAEDVAPDWAHETQISSRTPPAEEDYVWEKEAEPEEQPELDAESDWWVRDTGSLDRKEVQELAEAEAEAEEETVKETSEVETMASTRAVQPKEKPPAPAFTEVLSNARSALDRDEVGESLAHYKTLIKKKANLDKVISDLNEALQHRHPVNIDIWAVLGDAYAKNENLQKALDAYTKAEELIR